MHESGRAFFEIGFSFLDSRKAASIDEKKIDVPVLVVAGAEDRITPASVNRKIAHKYKEVATYMEFPHHAHWIFGEPGWETVAETIHFWLNQGKAGEGNDTVTRADSVSKTPEALKVAVRASQDPDN